MKKFIWASAHTPTEEQLIDLQSKGTVSFLKDLNPELHARMVNCPGNRNELRSLAIDLYVAGKDATLVQPAGSPIFLTMLGVVNGVDNLLFADSKRESKDIPQADGSVKKISIFKHLGWV